MVNESAVKELSLKGKEKLFNAIKEYVDAAIENKNRTEDKHLLKTARLKKAEEILKEMINVLEIRME